MDSTIALFEPIDTSVTADGLTVDRAAANGLKGGHTDAAGGAVCAAIRIALLARVEQAVTAFVLAVDAWGRRGLKTGITFAVCAVGSTVTLLVAINPAVTAGVLTVD